MTPAERRELVLSTGLFDFNHSVLPEAYRAKGLVFEPEWDLILTGTSNVIYYPSPLHDNPTWLLIRENGDNSIISFEKVLEMVPAEIRTQLLFHFDIFLKLEKESRRW